jgi:ABC-type branched-subunit amino acid transport system substrate-binding protein
MSPTRFAILVLFVSYLVNANLAPAAPLKIGVVGPLSGRIAIVGQTFKNTMLLAKKDNPAAQAQLIFEDDQFNPKLTVSAVQKLLNADKIDVLVVFGSGPSLAVADMVEAAKIPLVALAMSDKVVLNRPHVFSWFSSGGQQARRLAGEIPKRGYKSIALVTSETEVNVAIKNAFLKASALKPQPDIDILHDDLDLQTVALKIVAAKPDAVGLFLMPPQFSTLSQRLRELKYRGDFFGPSPLDNLAEIKAANGALEGTWLVGLDLSRAGNLFERYQKDLKNPHILTEV